MSSPRCRDDERLAAMVAGLEAKLARRRRLTPQWALATSPTLGDFARHYAQLRG